MLDFASFSASLSKYLAGNQTRLVLKLRFLGERRTVDLKVNAADIKNGKVFGSLWGVLKESVKKHGKKKKKAGGAFRIKVG
jgi:hypothetical protein